MGRWSGLDKAAVLLRALPKDIMERVLSYLGPRRVELVTARMKALASEPVGSEQLSAAVHEFEERLRPAKAAEAPAEAKLMPRLAAYRPPEEEATKDKTLPGSADDPLAALTAMTTEQLAAVLHGEQVQTIALVLGCLPGVRAGEVLRSFSPQVRCDVSVRMSNVSTSNPHLVARIAEALVQKSKTAAKQPMQAKESARYEKLASMLRVLDRQERQEVLAALTEKTPETAARVRDLLYQFADLLRVQDRTVQKLLAEIDAKTLAQALKGAEEPICNKIMSNLSRRARETLTEEMELMGSVPSAQVTQAQKVLVDLMRRLDEAGDLLMEE